MSNYSLLNYKLKNDRQNDVLKDEDFKKINYKDLISKPIVNNLNSNLKLNDLEDFSDNYLYLNSNNLDVQDKIIDQTQYNILNKDKELTIEGQGLNRWYNLYLNPQENCIEKFQRNGINSVLDVLDNHKPCQVTDEMLNGFGL